MMNLIKIVDHAEKNKPYFKVIVSLAYRYKYTHLISVNRFFFHVVIYLLYLICIRLF